MSVASQQYGPIVGAGFRPSGQLGCGSYDVYILGRGGTPVAVVDFPWQGISWSRTLDETSQAQVTGAAGDCCGLIADVRPWKHEVAIYRDGDLVWVGPLFIPSTAPETGGPSMKVTLDARDLSAWWDRRFIHSNHDYSAATDLATIFEAYANDAMAPDNSPGLTVSASACGVTGTRVALASQYLIAADELRSISGIGIDWTIIVRNALVGGNEVPTAPIAALTDEHFVLPPIPNLDGSVQGNRVVFVGEGVDAAGGNNVVGDAGDGALQTEDGLLEILVNDTTVTDGVSAQAGAASHLALIQQVTSVESATLAPTAPVSIADLVPGATCQLELTKTCPPVSGTFRIKRVDVVSNGDTPEAVTLTFEPEGTTA